MCDFCGEEESRYCILDNTKKICSKCHDMSKIKLSDLKKFHLWLAENTPEPTLEEEPKEFGANFINKFSNPTTPHLGGK